MDDPIAKHWWRVRRLYYGCLLAWFVALATYFGPNWILFDKLTWITPGDFAPTVQRSCVPVVRAMKQYERDHGRRPAQLADMVPEYLPSDPSNSDREGMAIVNNGEFSFWDWKLYNHSIGYNFEAGNEGWAVSGPFTHGKVPLPPVVAGPSTKPSTKPAAHQG